MKVSTERLIEVFHAAKARMAGADRERFLADACGDDLELKGQVLSLLQADEKAGDFLRPSQPPELRAATEQPGDKIGHYKLLQHIGEGGCGVVYMAEQEVPVRRRVALKIIKLGMDTRQVVVRFEAERQALAMMDHPNIARVLDAGATQAGRPFFVMELVRGIKITDYCDQNRLTTTERLTLFIQVCQAIQHAHQKGVIHRDIKPSNILVTRNDGVPVPKVIDFGIAKATQGRLTDRTLFTPFEQFIGTPAYMSPEQAVMTSLDVDTRGDIYSLGVLLYELITGRTPFDQGELLAVGLDEMRRTIRDKEPPKPSTRLRTLLEADLTTTARCRQMEPPRLIHSVRGDLDWIVMKALEKDRARRYETASGLALDVQRHLCNEPVSARSPSNLYRLQKLVQRNRLAFAGAAAAVAALVLALVILGVSNVRITREKNQREAALKAKDAALTAAHTSEQRAREELFASLRSQARARRYSRQMGQRLDSLAALAEAARIRVDPGLRDDAIAGLAFPDVRPGPKWKVSRTNCVALACDAMRQRYALLDSRGVVTVRSIEGDQEFHRFETEPSSVEQYTRLAFSPDGRFLAKMGDWQKPLLWSLDSGEAILQDPPTELSELTFSANRRFVALAGQHEVRCFDLVTGRESSRWSTTGRVHSVQFHPSDNRIAVGYKDGPWISVYDPTDGRETAQLEIGTGWRVVVRWHPDGRHLAAGSTALGIQVWDFQTRQRVALLKSHAREMDLLTFHPSGNWLASWSWDGMIRLWEPTTGRQAMQFPLAVNPQSNLQFSRDGRWLGFFWSSEDEVQLLEFLASQEYFTLQASSGVERMVPNVSTTSPDDRLLAVAMEDGTRLWDLPHRREVAHLPCGDTEGVVFEADGRALWTCSKSNGLHRWAVARSDTNASELRVGPPRLVRLPFAAKRISSDPAVQTLAAVNDEPGRVMLLDLATDNLRVLPGSHLMAYYVALSPDIKWLATSGWHSDRAQLWDVETGQIAREWVVGLHTKIAFTPDSRELVVARSSEFNFLNVETLESNRRLRREIGLFAGDIAFSPDGKLMALEMAPAVVHLKDIATGRTVAQLEDPFGDQADTMCFSHDGTQLVVVSTYAAAVHVWDLRAIRARLKTMGLDWDWPEFPPTADAASSKPDQPLKVEVLSADGR